MPDVKVYIRREDIDKWNSIEKKSEFISNALNDKKQEVVNYIRNAEINAVKYGNPPKALEIPGVVRGSDFVPKPPDPETGYPCCVKARPCKHWQWAGEESAHINTITGKRREVI